MTGPHPKTECAACGRTVSVNGDGSLRAHNCVRSRTAPKFARAASVRAVVLSMWADAPADAKPTLQQIGDAAGVTRERARQILAEQNINTRVARSAVHARNATDELRQRLADAIARAVARPPCTVCGAWVIRGDYRTCSQDCSAVWNSAARYAMDDDEHHRHRVTHARSILRNSDRRTASQVAWAKRMLGPEPPPPNRRYSHRWRDLFEQTHAT